MTVARFYYFGVLAVPAPAHGDPGPSPAGRTVARRRGVGATAQALRQALPGRWHGGVRVLPCCGYLPG